MTLIPDAMVPHDVLYPLNLLAAMVWTGGMVAVTVATVAARRALEPAEQVRFFRALGRRYEIVASGALLVFAVTGVALAGRPSDWTGAESAVAALTALVAVLTIVGVLNARAVQRLRSQALAKSDDALDRRLRNAARTAAAVRILIAAVTLAAVITAAV